MQCADSDVHIAELAIPATHPDQHGVPEEASVCISVAQ
jgi:hypothetical protein